MTQPTRQNSSSSARTRFSYAALTGVFFTLLAGACSSGANSPTNGAPSGTAAVEAHVTFLQVNGADMSAPASVAVRTTPGTVCSIGYVNPAGQGETSSGLGDKKAGADGTVSWSWRLDSSTPKGVGIITVKCGRAALSVPIGIGQAIPFTPGASR